MISKYACFSGDRLIAHGPIDVVAIAAKRWQEEERAELLAIYADETGRPVDLDLRGSLEDVLGRLGANGPEGSAAEEPRRAGPGRPKLGVVSREVTLLPRHWEWLGQQPGGASATLRRLVEVAKRGSAASDAARRSQEAAYKFMAAMGGDYPGFEEASRALFAHDYGGLDAIIEPWPTDVRDHARRLIEVAAWARAAMPEV